MDSRLRHTRKCCLSICKIARARCKLNLALKRVREAYVDKWKKCPNCCQSFVDLTLRNFTSFLCTRHEIESSEFVRLERSYLKQISQINRHSRYLYLKHFTRQNLKRDGSVQCPKDSFPSAANVLEVTDDSNHIGVSQRTRVFVNTTYGQRRMNTAHSFGPPTCTCKSCGSVLWYEERVKHGSTIANPIFSLCCQKGKVQLPLYRHPPNYLQNLLRYNGDNVSKKFRNNIRSYNSVFAFTSTGGHVDNSVNNGHGPYVFRINGQNHHRIGSLLPIQGRPKFAQLYFYDTSNEVENRAAAHSGRASENMDQAIIANLIKMFNQCNELAKVFRMARDRFHSTEYQPITLRLLERRNRDGRQYNIPTASEIAALAVTSNVDSCGYRDIVIEERNGILKRINEKHPSFMSMQYPILFPYGEDGFRCNIGYRLTNGGSSTKRTFVTMREYYAYLIQYRPLDGTVLLLGGRIFQQFIVDCYTSIEEDRLCWVKNNQTTLRCELYNGLHDAISAGDTSARTIGRKVILPSSFTGGPRYMVQNYQDAMAICRWAGSPDYFVTYTCNPKWAEIELALLSIDGQRAEDRPDIVSRVFHLKLMELLHDIKNECHFGKVKALVYTIEFQKRGLPHAHILIFVYADHRPNTAGHVDSVVSAELPDKNLDPFAYQSVCQYMLHGPCGFANPQCPCMVDNSCSKHYPKDFSTETFFDKVGFPHYRRRNNGLLFETMSGFEQDNRWVVPHNVDLVVKYQSHINVEICNKARSVKYLFKYINKGHDKASVVIEDNLSTDQTYVRAVDEVKTYLDCRYISASEATWRIFEFDVQYRTPAVERLMFHMPGEHPVYFHETDCLPDVECRPNINKTMFNQWLETNKNCYEARQLTYLDFPTKWVWDKSTKQWKMRQKGDCIGRIYYAHPASGERFYLRMLLNIVRGPTCYQDIRTVDGIVYQDFKNACIAHGLLEDDREWDEALTEAGIWASARCLREMFATLLLFCEVSNPKGLWEKHCDLLSEDMEWKHLQTVGRGETHKPVQSIRSLALTAIEKILNKSNRSLTEFWSIDAHDLLVGHLSGNTLIAEEMDYDYDLLQSESEKIVPLLNEEQKIVFDSVLSSVNSKVGKFFFVYGSGGTGKTFLWNALTTAVRSEGKIVLAVASSGIASLLLPGGQTAHSKFKIPINLDDMSTCNISKQSYLADLLRHTDLIIWDEAPMVHRNALEAFEKSMTDIVFDNNTNIDGKIFGGKTVVLGGDFRQTLPVVPKGTRQMIVSSAINKSLLWDKCTVYTLRTNMRLNSTNLSELDVQKLSTFSNWILDVGEGNVHSTSLGDNEDPNWIEIPDSFLLPPTDDAILQIVNSTYPDLQKNLSNKFYLRERCILSPTNACVEEINSYVINMIGGSITSYLSADSISPISDTVEDHHMLYPPEFLNTLTVSGLPNHELRLKVGVPIMLLRNLNQNLGLCNGTRLIVTQLSKKVIEAEIVTGNNVGRKVLLPRIILTSDDTKWPFILRRRQFPVKVCFAMTINKSQGQTMQQVGVYLPRPVFTHGQLYVAISRTTSVSGLKIMVANQNGLHNYTQNIVYKEVFENLSGSQSGNGGTV